MLMNHPLNQTLNQVLVIIQIIKICYVFEVIKRFPNF